MHPPARTRLLAARLFLTLALAVLPVAGCATSTVVSRNVQAESETIADEGQRLLRSGNLDAALAEFERAIAINPELTVAYLGAGDIHRRSGDYTRAEESYREAARLEPNSFRAQYSHGLSLQLLQRVSEAIRAYLRALAIDPDHFAANLNLAIAYLSIGEPGQGVAFAERAVGIRPDDGPARVNLAATYAAMDRHADAVIEYQQAAERMELSPELLLGLADSLGRTGRYAEMAATLEQLVRVAPTATAYERLGSAWFRLRAYPDALRAFRQATELDPRHYPAWNGVGVCLLNRYLWEKGQDETLRDGAVEALRRSLRIRPNQPQIIELVRRYG